MTEDDTYKKLMKPTWSELSPLVATTVLQSLTREEMLIGGARICAAHGWTLEEFQRKFPRFESYEKDEPTPDDVWEEYRAADAQAAKEASDRIL